MGFEKMNQVILDMNLKKIRQANDFSQNDLAQVLDVSLHSIQQYEQRANDIDKAQAHTLYRLSRALGCTIENLFEKPKE